MAPSIRPSPHLMRGIAPFNWTEEIDGLDATDFNATDYYPYPNDHRVWNTMHSSYITKHKWVIPVIVAGSIVVLAAMVFLVLAGTRNYWKNAPGTTKEIDMKKKKARDKAERLEKALEKRARLEQAAGLRYSDPKKFANLENGALDSRAMHPRALINPGTEGPIVKHKAPKAKPFKPRSPRASDFRLTPQRNPNGPTPFNRTAAAWYGYPGSYFPYA